MRAMCVGWLAVTISVFYGAPCRAQTVEILVVAGDEAALERDLVAELGAIGFAAARREATVSLDRVSLFELAEREGASAVIAMRHTNDGLEVWVVDRLTGKLVMRVLSDADARTTVLRTVEVLRASFLEALHPSPTSTDPPASGMTIPDAALELARSEAAPVRTSAEVFALGASGGGAVSYDPGGIGFGGHVTLDVFLETPSPFAVRLWGVLPTVPLAAEATGGRAEQTVVMAGLAVVAQLLPRTSVVALRAGLGAGLVWMESRGIPSAGYAGQTVSMLGANVTLELGATFWLDDRVGIDLTWQGLLALPRPVLVFDGVRVAQWGEPAQTLSLGLRVRLWEQERP